MPSAAQLRTLWRRMPDRGNVIYRVQTTPGAYSNSTLTDCWWRPAGSGEAAPSQGVFVRSNREWFIPKEVYGSAPNTGDLIVNGVTSIDPAVVTWTVLGVTDVGALGAWKIDALSLQLQANLRDSANVSRPTLAQDSTGRQALSNYTVIASGIPAKLQTWDTEAEDALGRRVMPGEFTVYLGAYVDVKAKDKLTVSGVDYTIKSSQNPKRIDDLQTLTVELFS